VRLKKPSSVFSGKCQVFRGVDVNSGYPSTWNSAHTLPASEYSYAQHLPARCYLAFPALISIQNKNYCDTFLVSEYLSKFTSRFVYFKDDPWCLAKLKVWKPDTSLLIKGRTKSPGTKSPQIRLHYGHIVLVDFWALGDCFPADYVWGILSGRIMSWIRWIMPRDIVSSAVSTQAASVVRTWCPSRIDRLAGACVSIRSPDGATTVDRKPVKPWLLRRRATPLTLWLPLLPYGYSYKATRARPG